MYEAEFNGKKIRVGTKVSLFSLQGADRGTVVMLRSAEFTHEDKVLDLDFSTGFRMIQLVVWFINLIKMFQLLLINMLFTS